MRGAHLPFQRQEPVGGTTTTVRDAWPVLRQTYTVTYSACNGTKLILPGDRGTYVCEQLAQGCTRKRGGQESNMQPVDRKSSALPLH